VKKIIPMNFLQLIKKNLI